MEKTSLDSPLITSFGGSIGENDGITELGTGRREVLAEVRKQLCLAGPLIASSFFQIVLQVISVMFVGHLGELSLAGASMATSFAGVTGFSLMLGMGSALETLCGQSFGAKKQRMLGIHLQSAMLVLMTVCIPVAVVWTYTGKILKAVGQDPEISLEAGLYIRWLIPALFAYGLLQCYIRFLQTQNIVLPMMMATAFTTIVHIFVCWLLVFRSGLGYKGAALANSISYWTNVFLLVLYVKISPSCKESWTGFSREAFHNTISFIKLAIPSATMVCLEFWSFELLVLLSGLLPNPKLETSVLSITLNTAAMIFMIPFGLGAAVSTRVSNELGAGNPMGARLAAQTVIIIAICVGLVVALALILVRNVWGYAYSNELEVVKYVAVMLPILATSNFLDGIQCVLSGIARGCGWQKIGAFVNLGAYYVVGVPSAVLMSFVLHIGGKGLWMGIVCALSVQSLSLLIVTLCTDWDIEARKARDRVHSDSVDLVA
ncbi:protein DETOXIFICATION 16-like [Phalaenopsis equestris]|uniref:protein DETOXIFICATION 16-like n=1 Tax=Phalaenopsis equestris TaxID=78828 RepID=UPI0009E481B1|nr:protein DETOXIFICATION 16-like [Phalaenopsis equestris]